MINQTIKEPYKLDAGKTPIIDMKNLLDSLNRSVGIAEERITNRINSNEKYNFLKRLIDVY